MPAYVAEFLIYLRTPSGFNVEYGWGGMLLFGLTTAFLFAMIQRVWPLGAHGQHETR